MSQAKKQRTEETYELIYWPGIPGRGEVIRLALEEAGASYKDLCNESTEGAKIVVDTVGDELKGTDNVQAFAPPALRHGDLTISQLPNILLYLGPKLGLSGKAPEDLYRVNQVALTVFDLQNEAHDTHHPVAVGDYYENQKDEALRKTADFKKERIPKFLGYFNRVLKKAGTGFLVGDSLTYADLALFQIVDGLTFAFPNRMEKALKEYSEVKKHHEAVGERPKIKAYLESDRRQKYSHGIFRHYPELDD